VQSIERFFHVKEYCDEKAFKAAIHKLKSYASSGMRVLKSKEFGMVSVKSERGLTLRNSWINGS